MDRRKGELMSRVLRVIIVAFSLVTVGLAGVSAQDATPAASSALASLGLPELKVTITDTGIQAPAEASAGLTYVTLDNQSQTIADATFVVQPKGLTLKQIAADLAQQETIPDWVYTTTFAGGPVAPAGGTGAAIVDLSAGDWLIALTDSESSPSPATLKVTGEAESAKSGAEPADLKFTMKGYKFDFPDEVAAGQQVWEVTNDDPIPHFAVLLRYPGPVTEQDVEALLSADSATPPANLTIDPAKIEDGGYVPLHTQGKISWVEMNLTPGTYIALCFMSDKGSQVPHAAMGMYDIFTVPGAGATPTS
ncbi:MAG: hypothetical protein ACJ789_08495 [Thermomicrobiales bacterium]